MSQTLSQRDHIKFARLSKSNQPFKESLPKDQHLGELSRENLEEIIDMVEETFLDDGLLMLYYWTTSRQNFTIR